MIIYKVIDSNSHYQVGVCVWLKKFNPLVLHGPANSTDMSQIIALVDCICIIKLLVFNYLYLKCTKSVAK